MAGGALCFPIYGGARKLNNPNYGDLASQLEIINVSLESSIEPVYKTNPLCADLLHYNLRPFVSILPLRLIARIPSRKLRLYQLPSLLYILHNGRPGSRASRGPLRVRQGWHPVRAKMH